MCSAIFYLIDALTIPVVNGIQGKAYLLINNKVTTPYL